MALGMARRQPATRSASHAGSMGACLVEARSEPASCVTPTLNHDVLVSSSVVGAERTDIANAMERRH
jgi:hypothetical protein